MDGFHSDDAGESDGSDKEMGVDDEDQDDADSDQLKRLAAQVSMAFE